MEKISYDLKVELIEAIEDEIQTVDKTIKSIEGRLIERTESYGDYELWLEEKLKDKAQPAGLKIALREVQSECRIQIQGTPKLMENLEWLKQYKQKKEAELAELKLAISKV